MVNLRPSQKINNHNIGNFFKFLMKPKGNIPEELIQSNPSPSFWNPFPSSPKEMKKTFKGLCWLFMLLYYKDVLGMKLLKYLSINTVVGCLDCSVVTVTRKLSTLCAKVSLILTTFPFWLHCNKKSLLFYFLHFYCPI